MFIERLWCVVKYENVYPREYESPRKACVAIDEYMKYYNGKRLHQSLNYNTPQEIYFRFGR
ncbi:integrase core domain-containing protein [Pectinatus frisingensis]|uniref:integrase core domain-containing protein n=1 Tax=Pectinatus frisingensis TaxID=865 RepID=UPI003D8062FC